MDAILNISGISTVDHVPHVVLKSVASPSVNNLLPKPALSQMLDEPLFELKQLAAEGNQMAKQILTHEQTKEQLGQMTAKAAGNVPEFGLINIIAGLRGLKRRPLYTIAGMRFPRVRPHDSAWVPTLSHWRPPRGHSGVQGLVRLTFAPITSNSVSCRDLFLFLPRRHRGWWTQAVPAWISLVIFTPGFTFLPAIASAIQSAVSWLAVAMMPSLPKWT